MATAAQRLSSGVLGFRPQLPIAGTLTLAMSTVSTQLAFSFFLSDSKTLTAFRAFVSAITGSPTAANSTVEIQTDSSGAPSGTNVAGYTAIAASAAPVAGSWLIFNSGWTGGALSANTMYWVVLKTLDGTNFPTYRFTNGSGIVETMGTNTKWGWLKAQNTGSGWGTVVPAVCGMRLDFSDSTYAGLPVSNVAASADLVYSTRESGVKFTTSPGGILQVKGLAFGMGTNVGTPTGLRFGLRVGGGAAVYTQGTVPAANASGAFVAQYFASIQSIPASSVCRATIADASGNGDTSLNAFRLEEWSWDSDANSIALLPFEGTSVVTYTTDGTTFTDSHGASASSIYPFALLLDANQETGTASGGGGSSIIGG